MSNLNRFILKTDTNGVSPTGFNSTDVSLMMRKVSHLFDSVANGSANGNLGLALNPVAALATLTFTAAGTAADTITLGNVVVTLVASGATGDQINIGVSATATAANLVAFINAGGYLENLTGICTATSALGVVTLTAALAGTIGNGLNLAISSTAITITYAWGANTAGSEGTAAVFGMGL